jgi:hypothetical protein
MPCDIITFPGRTVIPRPDPAVAAIDLCEDDPERLFELACASLTIARGSDSRVTDPSAVDCLTTAFVALSELLGLTGEARS